MDALTHPTHSLPPVEALILPAALRDQMQQQVAQQAPEEACGLLAGQIENGRYRVQRAWAVENQLHSPVRYRLDPLQQLAVFDEIDSLGLILLAIYHSHPRGPDQPSKTDIGEAYYPEVVYLIWSGRTGEWECRGFTIRNQIVRETPLYEQDPR